MSSTASRTSPPDQDAREQALDAHRSILVQAPAGSGKTDLLTRRFLRLLSEVDEPGQIVAITFTRAAAAEMRCRILAELEKSAVREDGGADEFEEFSMEALAARALHRSRERNWNLIELPAQLRISTIDSFCRELALQQPLLSGLGGGLGIFEDPQQLYRRAARMALEQIDTAEPQVRAAIEALLLWRDNGWQEMEKLLVKMLAQRDRWMHGFVLEREQDWEQLRERLERPFARAIRDRLMELSSLLDRVPRARAESLQLARFGCERAETALREQLQQLAELAEFPVAPFKDAAALEDAREACACLAGLLLSDGTFRQRVDKRHGFPADAKSEKSRLLALIADLRKVPGLEDALAAVGDLPPARYNQDDWAIVRACFELLRQAAARLKVVFADAAAVDYIEVAQIAEQVLKGEEEVPGEAALAITDDIRHLLVDEFQDTSRRQHELLRRLIAAWPEREGRTCFVVGDPMQSIYFFRDADTELFPRVRDNGLEIPDDQPLVFHPVALNANFRTAASLVDRLNGVFEKVFAKEDGSGVSFTRAETARNQEESGPHLITGKTRRLGLHFDFMPQAERGKQADGDAGNGQRAEGREAAAAAQTQAIIELIRSHAEPLERARVEGRKYRIAVLGRARTALRPVAQALRKAGIPFRAVELEKLKERPEIVDALALARALLNPHDRVAWLGVLRAPWCGLSLADLHALAGGDDVQLAKRPIAELLTERRHLLSEQGRLAVERLRHAIEAAEALRSARPASALGTWIEQVWLRLGGAACVDAAAQVNLDLLWTCLDGLPNGEQDVLGPALDAALERLTAQPDPKSSGDCGVQLMTIHKAKGLEFEVVIVPELQAKPKSGPSSMLSWLERGVEEPDESGEATEFLIAPMQSKGAERSATKIWVDTVRRQKERQEARRLLYVAATRAREELHLFARLTYKTEKNLARSLVEPAESLLATAWPALQDEVRKQFAAWRQETSHRELEGGVREGFTLNWGDTTLESIAASGADGMAPAALRRLPPDDGPAARAGLAGEAEPIAGMSAAPFYRRHEGGLLSRALGTAVHSFLEELARLRETQDWDAARAMVGKITPKVAAQIRATGIERAQAGRVADEALEIALRASQDTLGQWILSPHAGAGSELRWAGVVDESMREVRIDRVFRAGAEPGTDGDQAWWIVDYKTAHPNGLDAEKALPQLREIFAPQLETYARVLRNLRGAETKVNAGLYYPRMMKLDWWEL